MKTVRKFLFENDFDAGNEAPMRNVARKAKGEPAPAVDAAPAPPPPPPEPTFSKAEMAVAVADAKAKALKEGQAKGKADAQAQIEAQIAAALASISNQVAAMAASMTLDRAAILGEAAGLALAMTSKILPELTRRGGLAEIEATIERCLFDQRREPRLKIRVPADLLPALEGKIAALAADKHFEGRADLIGDASLSGASCRIEWADGGLERHAEAIWRDVSVALERCLATQGIAPTMLAEATTAEPAPQADGDIVGGEPAAD